MANQVESVSEPVQNRGGHLQPDRNGLIALILGLLTAGAILLWIYQVNHALGLRVEATDVWSDYQVRVAKASFEEDPNLKQQYTDESDVLGRRAAELKDASNIAKYSARFSGFAALLFLLGTIAAVVAFLSKNGYIGYAGILLGLIGVGLEIKVLL